MDEERTHYELDQETRDRIERIFTYHAPYGDQAKRYEEIRAQARKLAYFILGRTPPSDEQKLAIDKLGEAVMHANAAIARNE